MLLSGSILQHFKVKARLAVHSSDMGSSFSGSTEFSAPAPPTVSTAVPANPPAKSAVPASPARDPELKTCWSCRVLSGSTLFGAGTYVYLVARRPLNPRGPPPCCSFVGGNFFLGGGPGWGGGGGG